MNYSNVFVILFLAGTFYDFFINQLLEFIDWSFRKKHGTEVPKELAGHVDSEKLKQVCAYEDAKYFFWIPKNIVNLAISVALVLSGFYVWVFNLSWDWTSNVYLTILLFVFLSSIPSTVLMIPFKLYREFKIEKKFGFSNMTLKMYILDSIKETLVSLLIAVPLILAAVAFIVSMEARVESIFFRSSSIICFACTPFTLSVTVAVSLIPLILYLVFRQR